MATPPSQGPPPEAIVMQMLMGAWISRVISCVTRLDIPDLLQEHGALTARELAESHGVNTRAEFLERALRACAGLGVFTEDASGRFGTSALSEVLTESSPVSVKKIVVGLLEDTNWKLWGGLPDAIRTGQPQAKAQLGMEVWDYFGANPKEMEAFGEGMKSNSFHSMRAVLEHCDFSKLGTVVDVGGGFGHLAIALLQRHPQLRASVLDLPDLMPVAERHAADLDPEVRARLTFVGGDMFSSVPPADAYVVKHIIHDWDDSSCIRLLENCRSQMQGDGRIFCVDAVLPPMGDTRGVAAKLLDLNMMVAVTGKERTEAQWRSLYDTAGLELVSITPLQQPPGTSTGIVEGAKS